MRIFTYIVGFIFILFSLVQLNDPDPFLWVLIYMVPAVVAVFHTHRKQSKYLLLGLGIIYLIGALMLFPPSFQEWITAEGEASSIGMKLPMIEEARESMGLFLCFLMFLFLWFKCRNA